VGLAYLPRPSGHLGVTESMHGEPWLPPFGIVTAEYVRVGGPGRPEGAGTQLTVFQDLGVPQRDPIAGLSADRHPEAAGEVLAEVQQHAAGRLDTYRHRLQRLRRADRRPGRRDQ